ncbi:hypothetical protein CRENPOLYSF2_1610002 [Crenothrix polyspora]|uniref:Uncharacterized protein n=1 Tax=Crenothrix polyspora TaxID=360316 RepID=A0A1R4H2A7_9GAMM|nr:hypothetical protein CRENPOLYSF2_1610002 [Crenothrix polyspora]
MVYTTNGELYIFLKTATLSLAIIKFSLTVATDLIISSDF